MKTAPKAWPDAVPVPLKECMYGIGLEWDGDTSKEHIDIDLQAIIVDKRGLIIDAVYYNNLVAMDDAIGHSGDDTDGVASGIDEAIVCHLDMLPSEVEMIIFVVAAYDYGSLANAFNARLVAYEEEVGRRVKQINVKNTVYDVDAVAMMRREPDRSWVLQELQEEACEGSHFIDIIEPTIGGIIRKHINGAPKHQKVSFEMDKGAITDFPKGSLKRLVVGMGGKLRFGATNVDIDISAVFYSSGGRMLGVLNGSKPRAFGCIHSGDAVAGAARTVEMDDEAITVDLPEVSDQISQIFFVLTVVKGTFKDVRSVYTRICDQACHQLARFDVEGASSHEHDDDAGLIVARLVRSPGNRWGFQAIGRYFKHDAKTGWKQAAKLMHKIFGSSPPTEAPPRTSDEPTSKVDAKTLDEKNDEFFLNLPESVEAHIEAQTELAKSDAPQESSPTASPMGRTMSQARKAEAKKARVAAMYEAATGEDPSLARTMSMGRVKSQKSLGYCSTEKSNPALPEEGMEIARTRTVKNGILSLVSGNELIKGTMDDTNMLVESTVVDEPAGVWVCCAMGAKGPPSK